jgi:hypothetical protein
MNQLRQNMALNFWFIAIVSTRDPDLALKVLVNGQRVIADRELQRLLRAF